MEIPEIWAIPAFNGGLTKCRVAKAPFHGTPYQAVGIVANCVMLSDKATKPRLDFM